MVDTVPDTRSGLRRHWLAWLGFAIAAASVPTLNMAVRIPAHTGGYAGYVKWYPGQGVLIAGLVVVAVKLRLADRQRRARPADGPSALGLWSPS